MSLCLRPPEDLATTGTGRPRATAAETTVSGADGEVCLCVWSVCLGTGGLQPQGLVCPGASDWGDWDPGVRKPSVSAGELLEGSNLCMHTCVFLLTEIQPKRGRGWGHWCRLHSCECWAWLCWSAWPAMSICAYAVYTCACVSALRPRQTWRHAEGSPASLCLLDLAAPYKLFFHHLLKVGLASCATFCSHMTYRYTTCFHI